MEKEGLDKRQLVIGGNIWKAILFLAMPVALNNLIQAMYNLVDGLFVANIGSLEIAAVTFVGPLNNLIKAIGDGLAIGATNLIGREIGREDYDRARATSLQVMVVGSIIGIIITIFCFGLSEQILLGASATSSLIQVADLYFKITVLSTPLIFINASYIAIKRAKGETLSAMVVNAIAIMVKVITTYYMIFHRGMGIESLAYSTIIGHFIVSMYAIYDVFLKKTIMRLNLRMFRINWGILKLLAFISLPVIIEKTSVSYSFVLVNKNVLAFGENVLAAYGITNRINSIIFSCVTGFGTGLAALISQNLGAEQAERARESIRKTFVIAIGLSIIVISVLLIFRVPIARMFTSGDEDLLYHTVNAMSVYSISVIAWAVFQVVIGIFQGTGQTKYNLYISIFRVYLFRVPLVILLSRISSLGAYSIWIAMLLSNVLTAVFALVLYFRNGKVLKLVGE